MWKKFILAALIAFSSVTASAATVVIEDDFGGMVSEYNQRWRDIHDDGDDVVIAGDCISACTRFMSLPRTCATPEAYFYFHAISDDEGKIDRAASIRDSHRWELPRAVALQHRYGAFSFGRVNTRPAFSRELAPGIYRVWRSIHGLGSRRPPFQVFLKVKATKLVPACRP